MGGEKRKTATATVDEAAENLHKLPRLDDATAADALLDLGGDLPSTGEAEATTDDSTYDIGSCTHLFLSSEELDAIARDLKDAKNSPTCDHYPCSTTRRGAAGMMECIECPSTCCTGEEGDREHPRGHAAWHAFEDQHWVALWCDEPSKGYCFQCGHVLRLGQSKVDHQDDYALVPRMVAGDGFVIRGMPNPEDKICYMNASLQCLLALGKLRTLFLTLDVRLGEIGLHLKQLFLETSSENSATHMLDPEVIHGYMLSLHPEPFDPKVMGDSHEFLTCLCDAKHNEGLEQPNNVHIMQGDALFPTFSDSIFSCELVETISCKSCLHTEVSRETFHGISIPVEVPSKDPLARSKPLQVGKSVFK